MGQSEQQNYTWSCRDIGCRWRWKDWSFCVKAGCKNAKNVGGAIAFFLIGPARPPSHAASENTKLHAAEKPANLNQDINNAACHLQRAREEKPHESRCGAGSLAAVAAASWHGHVTSSPPMRNQQCPLILTQCGWVDLSNHRGILLFQEDPMFAHHFNSAQPSTHPPHSPHLRPSPHLSRQIENDPQEFALYCVHQSGGQCVHRHHHQ